MSSCARTCSHRTRARQAGFSLVELMVVVAIIGIVSAGAGVLVRSDTTPKDARQVDSLVREARRQALARGSVDPVAVAAGNVARVQIEFVADANGASSVRLWVLDDSNPTNAVYVLLSENYLSSDTKILGVGNTAAMFDGDPLPTPLSGSVLRNVYADGSCDAMTVYLQHKIKPTRFRVAVPPVTSIPAVYDKW